MKPFRSRRSFLQLAVDQISETFDGVREPRSFKIDRLFHLSNEELGRLVPLIVDASTVVADGDSFFVQDSTGNGDFLFKMGSREEDVWARMDGRATLQQIAVTQSLEWGEEVDISFERVRRVFLELVGRSICLPGNTGG